MLFQIKSAHYISHCFEGAKRKGNIRKDKGLFLVLQNTLRTSRKAVLCVGLVSLPLVEKNQ